MGELSDCLGVVTIAFLLVLGARQRPSLWAPVLTAYATVSLKYWFLFFFPVYCVRIHFFLFFCVLWIFVFNRVSSMLFLKLQYR